MLLVLKYVGVLPFLENVLLLLDCIIAVIILLTNIINDNNKVLEIPMS